jgi:hypothetical protein
MATMATTTISSMREKPNALGLDGEKYLRNVSLRKETP